MSTFLIFNGKYEQFSVNNRKDVWCHSLCRIWI